jgi:hypothetical protein
MTTTGAARFLLLAALLPACGMFQTPGYDAASPGEVTCGCHDGETCYEGASSLAKEKGENDATAEQLMYFAQCACFQGSMAGCNTLGHFAKDWTRACTEDRDVKTSCAIAGLVYYHGLQIPRRNGRSFDRDPAAAKAAFEKGCKAGSPVACSYASK